MSGIPDRVKGIFANCLNLNDQQVREEARIIDDLGADSLDIVEIVVSLEENFHIKIPGEEAEKMVTVGDAIKYIKDRAEAPA